MTVHSTTMNAKVAHSKTAAMSLFSGQTFLFKRQVINSKLWPKTLFNSISMSSARGRGLNRKFQWNSIEKKIDYQNFVTDEPPSWNLIEFASNFGWNFPFRRKRTIKVREYLLIKVERSTRTWRTFRSPSEPWRTNKAANNGHLGHVTPAFRQLAPVLWFQVINLE